uniref:Alternative protein AP3B1 n=1 Tax=Homo sapiens TaxID=9606 RepID=L8EA53_HUMAN|nr:alternative protein AP3B1 [Homo sapiens]
MQYFPPFCFANQRAYILLSVVSTLESMWRFLCPAASFGLLVFLLFFDNGRHE